MDNLSGIEGERCWVGIAYGNIGIKWGPYTGPAAGDVLKRLQAVDPDHHVPCFISLELGAPDDPLPQILKWAARDQSEPQTRAENEFMPLGMIRDDGAIWSTHGWQSMGRVWVTMEQIAPVEARGWKLAENEPARPFMDTLLYAVERP